MYIDIHTHKKAHTTANHFSIYNLQASAQDIAEYEDICSIGIHPWQIPTNYKTALQIVENTAAKKNVVAIGECGLDKLCNTPYNLQITLFEEQIKISEKHQKPLIIHCVKSYNEIVAIKSRTKAKQPWIIHGFRGNPETARMLTNKNIMVSIGEKYNPKTVAGIEIENLLIETDESNKRVEEIYSEIAKTRGESINKIAEDIKNNYQRVFKVK